MSVRHIQVLVMGFPGSGKTTLITRWVTGRLPSDESRTLPFNGVKSVNISSKKNHKKEMVVVRFIDGSDVSDTDLRRLCYTVDVIVACMCVELNGLDEGEIRKLNEIFTSRRPPIIVLGTMLDLRYNYTPIRLPSGSSSGDENNIGVEKNEEKRLQDKRTDCVTPGELTVENVTRHRVSFSVSTEGSDQPGEATVLSEGEQSDVNERIMASITESDGNTDLDMSSVSIDIHNASIRKKNPAFWSTESINGSLVTKLDQSQDSWLEQHFEEQDKLLENGNVSENKERHLTSSIDDVIHEIDKTEMSKKVNPVSYPKPLIETHFPLNLDIPLTVKHFPKQWNDSTDQGETAIFSKTVIPYKEDDWFSEDEPDDMSFREISSRVAKSRTPETAVHLLPDTSGEGATVKPESDPTVLSVDDLLSSSGNGETRHLKENISSISAATPTSSVLPEDRNFHVNLDAEPVRLEDHDRGLFNFRVNIDNYCRNWSIADGLSLVKSVRGDTYMECSAYTGQNLQEVFEYIARTGCKYNKKRHEKCSIS